MLRKLNKKYVKPHPLPLERYGFLKLCTASYKLSNIMLTAWKLNITCTQTVPFRISKSHLPQVFILSCSQC
jgi:hypothetical protein